MTLRGLRSSVVLVAAAVLTTACSPNSSAAAEIAVKFVQAVSERDGATACALLTPTAQDSAGGAAGVPCREAVLHLDEHGSNVSRAQVWGDTAIVDVGADTVFLRRLADGWRVSAAGCSFRADAPYDCDLEA